MVESTSLKKNIIRYFSEKHLFLIGLDNASSEVTEIIIAFEPGNLLSLHSISICFWAKFRCLFHDVRSENVQ